MINPSVRKGVNLAPWFDIVALLAWGFLLLKYAITGELALLIHPNYFGLCTAAGIILLLLGLGKLWQQVRPQVSVGESVQHITLLPQNVGSGLLILVAIAGFLIPPTILSSQTAIQRGLTEELPLTRSQPESFRLGTSPEERTLLDWIRTLNVYPEPDAYTGDPVKVKGFVTHLPQLPDNYMMVSRFVLTCCAVDAYPVGLPVKLEGSRQAFTPDSWVEVSGEMITEDLQLNTEDSNNDSQPQRQLVIQASTVEPIPTPRNPYDY
ncbi:MAG: TIGR03943 family protein [Synechococcus sp.]|nr:TIGR03943 family protein [Synechococcus sp.]